MPLSRRYFIGITASAVALTYKSTNAQDERALFWRIETPEGGRGVVFGYARVAAAVAPDVTKDGVRFMESAKRVLLDMNNARFPAMKIDPSLPPLLPKLDPARAQQVRSILTSMHMSPAQFENLPGFFIASLLYAEGQTNPAPSVGGIIAERAKALGRPMTVLLEAADVEHLRKPVDFARIDQSVNAATIEFLLDARQRVGQSAHIANGSIGTAKARNWSVLPRPCVSTVSRSRRPTSTPRPPARCCRRACRLHCAASSRTIRPSACCPSAC
jgi:hypothetical protein